MFNKIVLSMIVKNEAHVIERCLNSVKPFISYWVISDTGSTDGTQDVIRKCLDGIPGQIVENKWLNYGHNRTEALEQGRGLWSRHTNISNLVDYVNSYFLVMDADDILSPSENFHGIPILSVDAYDLKINYGNTTYKRPQLFKLNKPFFYQDVLHEYLECKEPFSRDTLEGLEYKIIGGGGSHSDPKKYLGHAEILHKELLKDPTNARYVFYLAQSLRDAGLAKNAVAAYERRAAMPGWDEEAWTALYEAAKITERLGEKEAKVVAKYLKCFEFRPTRAEPLYELSRFYRSKNRTNLSFVYASAAMEIPFPLDKLFLDESVYTWRILDEYAISAFYAGFKQKSFEANTKLLNQGFLPQSEVERIEKNIRF